MTQKELMCYGFTVEEDESEAQTLAGELIWQGIDFSVEHNKQQDSFTFKLLGPTEKEDEAIKALRRELELSRQEVGLLQYECNKLEDDREYNASLVFERDIEIQKLREQVATLTDPARLAQALSAFTMQQSELALTEKEGTC